MDSENQNGILNYTIFQLIQHFDNLHLQQFRVDQILDWIYDKGATSFEYMSNISADIRSILKAKYYIYRPIVISINKSTDGSIKFLLKLIDNNTIETVYIPDNGRNTVCISSQVGCAVGCKFCNTGHNGFKRSLSAEEIISQVFIVKDYLKSWSNQSTRISNIVIMGMGEPLYNWENIKITLENLRIGKNQKISNKHITLSTAGITPVFSNIIQDLECNLAISLHAPNSSIRSSIMPVNKIYDLAHLLNVCKEYNKMHPNKVITFEYLMLHNINDSRQDAKQLIKLLHGIKCKINLIQFNIWKNSAYIGSTQEQIKNFQQVLKKYGMNATIRYSKGQDIMAACGQLQSAQKIVD